MILVYAKVTPEQLFIYILYNITTYILLSVILLPCSILSTLKMYYVHLGQLNPEI